jgi:hypothetical protein
MVYHILGINHVLGMIGYMDNTIVMPGIRQALAVETSA